MEVYTLKQLRQRQPMAQVQIRLPKDIRRKAKELAKERSVNESDVYRTAIYNFFSQISTDSREPESEAT